MQVGASGVRLRFFIGVQGWRWRCRCRWSFALSGPGLGSLSCWFVADARIILGVIVIFFFHSPATSSGSVFVSASTPASGRAGDASRKRWNWDFIAHTVLELK